jgi:NADH-quinone oxidoreductase subunit J
MMELFVFGVGAAACLAGAGAVVFAKHPVHAALGLVGTLFGIAILFIAQEAEFLAAVQVIVYAGAVVVMILFVIMLLGVDREEDLSLEPLKGQRAGAIVVAALTALGLIGIVVAATVTGAPGAMAPEVEGQPNIEQLAETLFTDHVFAFQATGVLLTIAVLGAVTMARHRREVLIDVEPDETGGAS